MSDSREYAGIDYFRIIAALLVVAIHISPLININETADFILTRIVGRVAVPFFFMVSGFFLFSDWEKSEKRLKNFLKKTVFLYGISIIIYIPVNIYTGYFKMDNLFINILKDVFIEGTMYHLWYLPASIFGAVVAWNLIRKMGHKDALSFAVFLYLIGLFGDSYFGLIKDIPLLSNLYGLIFQVSDYTRNGLFFAPIFFILGSIIRNSNVNYTKINNFVALLISLSLMLIEGLILHSLEFQRHDSMYIMLVPTMFFLFRSLILYRGKRVPTLGTGTMVVYIIHPMMIIFVRLMGKILKLEWLLVENNIIHYIMVTLLSTMVAILVVWWEIGRNPRGGNGPHKDYTHKNLDNKRDRAWIEVNLDNLKHNVTVLQEIMPRDCHLMAVVKADAYGHGGERISSYLNKIGIKSFAVATIDEGIALRKKGVVGDILILGYTDLGRTQELWKYKLIQTIVSYDYGRELSELGYDLKVHIKIDTGMHRMGIDHRNVEKIAQIFKLENLEIRGIYTHLAVSDSRRTEDMEFTEKQIGFFYELLKDLKERGVRIPKTHIQSSYGLLNYPEIRCDYARIGMALYGVLSENSHKPRLNPDIRPVLSLKSKLRLIRDIKTGESLGYGRAFIANKNTRIGIVPIGYGDGVPRNLSCGRGSVLINGCEVPIVGRICMDQLMIDITDIPEAKVGDTIVLIGTSRNREILATDFAANGETISNEILCRLGSRLNKIYV